MTVKPIYLDYAATTPVDRNILLSINKYYSELFYNPASTHVCGQAAAKAVERAREQCAVAINAEPRDIRFTSGGTEAINQAMLKTKFTDGKNRVVVSGLEHDSVLACANRLAEKYTVDYVMPNTDGVITPDALRAVMREDTALVCVMTVNNIVGTIQPIKELCDVAHSYGALFFTDAVQAVNSIEIDVKQWGVDLLAVSGHKFYAPKGSGFLYVRRGVDTEALIVGGDQEYGLRAGTVDVPSVVALGEAVSEAVKNRERFCSHIAEVSAEFMRCMETGEIIAKNAPRTGDILSLAFDGINGGRLAVALSCAGVCCSVGSACSAGSATPPQTLVNMGIKNPEHAVRFSFGRQTTSADVRNAARIVNETVKKFIQ